MRNLPELTFAIFFLAAAGKQATAQVSFDYNYDCDFYSTTCPEFLLFNGECESDLFDENLNPCWQSDCFDCDPCAAFNADCAGCTANGCYWCPGDGACSSAILDASFWDKYVKESECNAQSQWISGQCPENPPQAVYNDPLYSAQSWVYELMNVEDVWRQGITGKGVMIRVNDPHGVDATVPELAPNFNQTASCPDYMPPIIPNITLDHGTVVASIALGAGNNSECAVGVAPGASLSACLGPLDLVDSEPARFFTHGITSTHISVNSWGFDACDHKQTPQRKLQRRCPFQTRNILNPCLQPQCNVLDSPECQAYVVPYCQQFYENEYQACAEYLDLFISCRFNVLSKVGRDAITKGITDGRNGLGIIYVFAAGNEFAKAEDINMEGWLNTRFTIIVGAVGKNGYHASYSTGGPALFVAGPGGDFEYVGNHMAAAPGGGCTSAGVGTSFAAPAVAGVIALMLEVNPLLSWRDVQGILALTSQRVYPEDESWTENGAGIVHSNLFGFGLADATAAVLAARDWLFWGTEHQIMTQSTLLNTPIPDADANEGVVATLTITEDDVISAAGVPDLEVESVVVYLKLNHSARGDLLHMSMKQEVMLRSPSGTRSVLSPGNRIENTITSGEEQWKLLTVKNWKESPLGAWTLRITDVRGADAPQCVDYFWQTDVRVEDEVFRLTCQDISDNLPKNISECTNELVADLAGIVGNVFDNRTALSACCRCGGGVAASSIPNSLISWSLAIYGHEPVQNSVSLQTPCGGSCTEDVEFCGNDNKCHPITCADWWQFGPVEYTGRNPRNPPQLVCYNDYEEGAEDFANAITYGCSALEYRPGTQIDDADSATFYHQRKCTAELPGGLGFACYEIAEGTNFDNYFNEVAALGLTSCPDGTSPNYYYPQLIQQRRGDLEDSFGIYFQSTAFNETLALRATWAVLREDQDACYPSGLNACPFEDLFDGECQDCVGDCFDCDPCQQHSYDCNECVQSGCFWCPGDATCQSEPRDESFWLKYGGRKKSTCPLSFYWIQTCQDPLDSNAFSDPLYDSMAWIYDLINVEEVWAQGITGKGVHVRVNDDGVDATHAEFADKFDVANSCSAYTPADEEKDNHGTAVASIIASNPDNGVCAVGIAPEATVSACVTPPDEEGPEAVAAMFLTQLAAVDISTNSWGPVVCVSPFLERGRSLQECPFSKDNWGSPCELCKLYGFDSNECHDAISDYCLSQYQYDKVACADHLDLFVTSCEYHMLDPVVHEAFVRTMVEGRGGKGVIYVFGGGNDLAVGVNTNDDGFINSRFTIAVGAVGHDGLHASYSTPGAAVFVTAPGGDSENVSNNIVAKPGGGCHDITVGTSFAAPVVSGVIALMLEVNNNLHYRDVQAILATTSTLMDPTDGSWVTNGFGVNHSYNYGFGLVNAEAAVNASITWTSLGPELLAQGYTGEVNLDIPDVGTPVLSTASVSISDESNTFVVEHAVVFVKVKHPSRGDLKITLTSPSGTESILTQGGRPENQQLEETEMWKLMTLRTWGEDPTGTWTLEVVDEVVGVGRDCVDSPWAYYSFEDDETISCEKVIDCDNEELVTPDVIAYNDNGLTINDACCVCGGGSKVVQMPPVLMSWRLIVYGHDPSAPPAESGSVGIASTDFVTVPTSNSTTPTETSSGATLPNNNASGTTPPGTTNSTGNVTGNTDNTSNAPHLLACALVWTCGLMIIPAMLML
ncbi:Furin-like protease 1, isoform 1 [Seminavis robusta]|uniref:subtilisin n=1 Tax=Seminavis robusta TaxID=568900 RepID=A0A9N8DKQ5_9STRA|nr:Furin-like protease 1, isoform 1 [Seminavis robusta]|eukprot:Sro175_g077150.1 Furin-like protease 1, isoform 1 (1701) ;mRNA; r:78235-85848